ncbi:MAG: ABC transporter ATP-binding protein [Deltaproteobacteria bacterium CG_4_8_14_3_um_filter_45_9]|nr:MAG: ABC transporter ATP-binding protein [Deltaproteobacteria bacterium CG_4_8_14_3_um_filter_45_9]
MIESTPVLEIKNLEVKRGGVTILNVSSLLIHEGEILALIGPNGAGKTTLLQTLSYLLKPFQGEIFFKGEKVETNHSVLEYRRKLAMVFQEPLLFDTTVFSNVASGLKIRGMRRNEIRDRVIEQLNRFGIGHLNDRSAKTLSGGESQRTSLARAFALRPEILLLDEPFASLDPLTRDALIEDLEHILRQTQTTAILATHDRMEALRLSDRIAVMNAGKILQIGSPSEVMNQPVDEFVASFVGVETILSGRVIKRNGGTFVASVEGREIEAVGDAHLEDAVILCIRPENVTLSTQPFKEGSSARNVVPGRIVKITPLGFYQKVQLDCGFLLVAYITNHSLEELSLIEGKEVRASFKATAVTVIRKEEN